ncbi:MAG: ATP-binding cassette domain-containing protein [Bacilli bacterium]|jgi:putative ABC transport system permease protein
MLNLKNIFKDYISGNLSVRALKGVNLAFRQKEFVAILGPSGCGKTTLLNIIGGLDEYSHGDLVIDGKSTKKFNDHDWDTYRNHRVGFVFQTYNLIAHQSVLSNVELSLTLSGISKGERRKRAVEALTKVGLADQINKKPNQLSGGQMQRVAIARAIVNNPHIILADEPTGALDTETSVQVLEILKNISKDHLVIMVTHNPELAKRYATRIIRLLDGEVQSDSNPLNEEEVQMLEEEVKNYQRLVAENKVGKEKRVGMSLKTAFMLSLNNLLTKKGRTILTAFAGSIGIIGIALILSLSSGFQNYISRVEEETLSSYPITIETVSTDLNSLANLKEADKTERDDQHVYSNDVLTTIITAMASSFSENDLKTFKTYLDENKEKFEPLVTDIQYIYDVDLNIYKSNYETKLECLNPYSLSENLSPYTRPYLASFDSMMQRADVWQELIGNQEFLESQYQLAAGAWPTTDNEVVLVMDKDNGIADYLLYAIGLREASEIDELIIRTVGGDTTPFESESYEYEDILGLTYRVASSVDYYEKQADGSYVDKHDDAAFVKQVLIDKGFDLKISGIVKPAEDASSNVLRGAIAYSPKLSTRLIDYANASQLLTDQRNSPNKNLLTGEAIEDETALNLVLVSLGQVDYERPSRINIYPVSFAAKENINDLIEEYNQNHEQDEQIKYTDYVGLLMASVSTIINAISYVLIAFVSISLIVSSIMIGIITNISVLERTKEIGILRAIGASKRDISRVFNCETFIEGLAAGLLGVVATVILDIPVNFIIDALADIGHVAALPWQGAVILVIISVVLTLIAGIIPARAAAKKDPVEALRSE